jgi:hypothetical protein
MAYVLMQHAENEQNQLEAIEAIILAMKSHPAHPGVQEFACGALGSLAFDKDRACS